MLGKDRDAGCDCNSGMSKSDSVAMLPEARREIDTLAVWIGSTNEDIVKRNGCSWSRAQVLYWSGVE